MANGVFVEQLAVLEAVVELAEHAVEDVASGGCAPDVGLAASPVVVSGPGRVTQGGEGPRGTRPG
jgi:hypothetical protein